MITIQQVYDYPTTSTCPKIQITDYQSELKYDYNSASI